MMMKTLCVAVVVLTLTSVCQAASLACEKLLKPVETGPDLSGRWYTIAVTSDSCLTLAVVNSLFLISAEIGITAKDTPNLYDSNFKVKINGFCEKVSERFFYVNNTVMDVDKNNAPTGTPDVLLQSGCSDCLVIKADDYVNTLLLLSRRKNLMDAEMQEFEAQKKCLGWTKTLVFNTDHDYENCPSIDDITEDSNNAAVMYQRLKANYQDPLKCLHDNFLYYLHAAYQQLQQLW